MKNGICESSCFHVKLSSLGHAWKVPVSKQNSSLSLSLIYINRALWPIPFSVCFILSHTGSSHWSHLDYTFLSIDFEEKTVSAPIGKFTGIHPRVTKGKSSCSPAPAFIKARETHTKERAHSSDTQPVMGNLPQHQPSASQLQHMAVTQAA